MKRVLFVCTHNAGRSQMAEAMFNHLATQRGADIRAISAGTQPGDGINETANLAMAEIGLSLAVQKPKILTQEGVDSADRVITMGCGVNAESCPARFIATEDWGLEDPAGRGIEKVREIREQIRCRVENLLDELDPRPILGHEDLNSRKP